MYIKVDGDNFKNYSIAELKRDNPDISFPKTIPVTTLEKFGVFPVITDTKPIFDESTKTAVLNPPALVNGEWRKTYSLRDLTPEEISQKLDSKRSEMVVTMRQARLALLAAGKLDLVDDAIALIPEPDHSKIKIEWQFASTVERKSPWMSTMGSALGLSDEEIDQLFESAKNL